MECSCTASDSYGGDGGSWGEQHRRAAKPHECYECGGEIAKGEHYWFHTIFYEGTISNFKVCETCEAIINQFFSDGWMFGTVHDQLKDYFYFSWKEDLPSSCISKLPDKARDIVCDYLQEFQEC